VSDLTDFEQDILRLALSGKGKVLDQLRRQLDFLSSERRDFTGVGFFTKIQPIDDKLRIDVPDFEITDIEGATSTLTNGFGCVIFIRNGQVDLIECFTYDEPWPIDLTPYKLTIAGNSRPSFDRLIRNTGATRPN
jgi:hypothetical protein